ncbi:hypothetical protein BCR44DRAFT_61882 [Catenaria anguillulae PL171]|uniref:Uncharacterized protein n=1 Tax=Catenaria anguillulae PL171 TaxID=765915 RepID=A0A1Y2I323_9FUNG|nr:hypothetical protein BCR44DRAFT_61882 [Catenaria anguillulae PL171]
MFQHRRYILCRRLSSTCPPGPVHNLTQTAPETFQCRTSSASFISEGVCIRTRALCQRRSSPIGRSSACPQQAPLIILSGLRSRHFDSIPKPAPPQGIGIRPLRYQGRSQLEDVVKAIKLKHVYKETSRDDFRDRCRDRDRRRHDRDDGREYYRSGTGRRAGDKYANKGATGGKDWS